MASSVQSMSYSLTANENMYKTGKEEQEAKDKLKAMGNRKAISSADFENNDQMNAEMAQKFNEFKATGATQISSDMMFGRTSAPDQETSAQN